MIIDEAEIDIMKKMVGKEFETLNPKLVKLEILNDPQLFSESKI